MSLNIRFGIRDMLKLILCTHMNVLEQVSNGWYDYWKAKYDKLKQK